MATQIERAEIELDRFEKLCHKAKVIIFDWLLSIQSDDELYNFYACIVNGMGYDSELTPIEQIFDLCCNKYIYTSIDNEFEICKAPFKICILDNFMSQDEIILNGKKYIIDFTLDFSRKSINSNDYLYPKVHDLKYAVELDGFEYHSSKQQVNHDYEREQDLLAAGYKVIRFTGSQIYKDPFKCVDKFFKIVKKDIGERLNRKEL